ncbi:glycoside hydrolase family 19 protein [Methyloferula stellata]|uniref:glycoside hydrolase family 19 protein n=1 Tax=Methyloferula stellata TaxID=876270 RepID=UPI00036F1746|nr:glycoside hydrolase family 19 protein [Methyloferula stellata]
MIYPSAKDLRMLAPFAKQDIIEPFCENLKRIGPRYGFATINRAAHFIGQCAHESDGFHTRIEYASGREYERRKDLGNTRPGDGMRFKGEGEIELTGRANYARATPFVRAALDDSSIDLVAHPELVAARADISFAVDCWFWHQGSGKGDLNLWADRDHDDRLSFQFASTEITRAINGGVNGLKKRQNLTLIAKRILRGLNRGTGLA